MRLRQRSRVLLPQPEGDEGGDAILFDGEVDVEEDLLLAVGEVEGVDLDEDVGGLFFVVGRYLGFG